MRVVPTELPGVVLVEPDIYRDARGFLTETYNADRYRDALALDDSFVQDNFSRSSRGVLRGMHFQRTHPQGKLVRVSRGRIFDVAVDVRPSSVTFGRWVGAELTETALNQMWIPEGFAHGFYVLSEVADVHYKCTGVYRPDDEAGLRWDCETVKIQWPDGARILSDKDAGHPGLEDLFLIPGTAE